MMTEVDRLRLKGEQAGRVNWGYRAELEQQHERAYAQRVYAQRMDTLQTICGRERLCTGTGSP